MLNSLRARTLLWLMLLLGTSLGHQGPRTGVLAADQPNGRPSILLGIGESHQFCVVARNKYNDSGVFLETGAHYEFHVARNQVWYDARIRCGANGWTTDSFRPLRRAIVDAVEKNRRCRCANWFELIGTVRCNHRDQFRIGCRGTGWNYTPVRSGKLYTFANDLESRYGNNSGSIVVTIRRVAEPARPLPTCCR